jgi:hypothetical protein
LTNFGQPSEAVTSRPNVAHKLLSILPIGF